MCEAKHAVVIQSVRDFKELLFAVDNVLSANPMNSSELGAALERLRSAKEQLISGEQQES